MSKTRLDVLLVEKGIAPSREKARGLILSGVVFVDGQRVDKAGQNIKTDSAILVKEPPHSYVSRGGLKLEKAIKHLGVKVEQKVILDVGASTGGFTDCALQSGAQSVIAVDVGSGQLAWKLRNDPRVHVMEKTNIRYVTPEQLPKTPDMATIDVSFISLGLVLPVVHQLLQGEGEVVALIKPQFEAGREIASRSKGVIKDKETHVLVVDRVLEQAASLGWTLIALTHSPITGPEGNIEFIAWWDCKGLGFPGLPDTCEVVSMAHKEFGGRG